MLAVCEPHCFRLLPYSPLGFRDLGRVTDSGHRCKKYYKSGSRTWERCRHGRVTNELFLDILLFFLLDKTREDIGRNLPEKENVTVVEEGSKPMSYLVLGSPVFPNTLVFPSFALIVCTGQLYIHTSHITKTMS